MAYVIMIYSVRVFNVILPPYICITETKAEVPVKLKLHKQVVVHTYEGSKGTYSVA